MTIAHALRRLPSHVMAGLLMSMSFAALPAITRADMQAADAGSIEMDGTAATARDVALRLFDAFNRHDLDALASLYADDAELVSPDHAEPLLGRGGVRTVYAALFAQFPDVRDRIVSITVDGDRAAIEFVSTGCSAERRCFRLPIASVLTVRAGHIVRDASYFDVQP